MKILSLFDGMACGMLAMQAAGIKVDRYVAFEIDKYAIQTSSHNFPMIEHKGNVFGADFTEFADFDFVLAGFPCTKFSIAQKNGRETQPYSGEGWELFEQAWRAVCEAKPKYFLFENNKSMAKAVQQEISRIIGFEPICINSALVSAQNRQRLYWVGKRNPDGTYSRVKVNQPGDRGILLRDVLDSIPLRDKGNCLCGNRGGACIGHDLEKSKHNYAAEMVAQPIRIGTYPNEAKNKEHDSQQYRIYSTEGKGVTLCGNGGGMGAKTGLYAIPLNTTATGKSQTVKAQAQQTNEDNIIRYAGTTYGASGVAEPVCVEPESYCFAVACEWDEYGRPIKAISGADGKIYRVHEVKDGQITIKGKSYPIKLADGFYIIRKLTVSECKRLQTVPEWYEFPVSDTQAYKMLGNGWTVLVICHLIAATQKVVIDVIDCEQMNIFDMVKGGVFK